MFPFDEFLQYFSKAVLDKEDTVKSMPNCGHSRITAESFINNSKSYDFHSEKKYSNILIAHKLFTSIKPRKAKM
jgi:hypothetical protein